MPSLLTKVFRRINFALAPYSNQGGHWLIALARKNIARPRSDCADRAIRGKAVKKRFVGVKRKLGKERSMGNGNGESCLGCHLRVEAANRLMLPDRSVAHRDKPDCTGMRPSETEVYVRLARHMEDLAEAYLRATGRVWDKIVPALRSGRYAALRRSSTARPEHFVS